MTAQVQDFVFLGCDWRPDGEVRQVGSRAYRAAYWLSMGRQGQVMIDRTAFVRLKVGHNHITNRGGIDDLFDGFQALVEGSSKARFHHDRNLVLDDEEAVGEGLAWEFNVDPVDVFCYLGDGGHSVSASSIKVRFCPTPAASNSRPLEWRRCSGVPEPASTVER